jgi:hypothetical protein
MHLSGIVVTRHVNERVKADGRSASLQPILPIVATRPMHEGDGRRSIPIIGAPIESVIPDTKRITGNSNDSATAAAEVAPCLQMYR